MKLLRLAIPAAFALGLAVFVGVGLMNRGEYSIRPGAAKDAPSAYSQGRPNAVGAMFYSAWCSACKVLEPRLQKILPEFEGRAVEFSKLDVSFGRPDALRQKAVALGVEQVYLANPGATGFMALVDRRTGRALATITLSMTDEQIRATINAAIREASGPVV